MAIWSGGEHKWYFERSVITVMSFENICDIPGDKPQVLWELLHYCIVERNSVFRWRAAEDKDILSFFPIKIRGSLLQTKVSYSRHFVTYLALELHLWRECLKNRHLRRDSEPEDHTHTPQQNLLFSGAGPGGGRVCAVTSFAELLIDPLRNYESEGKLAGQTDKHTWSRHEKQETRTHLRQLVPSSPALIQQLRGGGWGAKVRPYHLSSPANWEAPKHIWSIPLFWLQQLK